MAAVDLGLSQGEAVLGLLQRAVVPPLPVFYKLLYDYVSGVEGLHSGRIGDILAEGERGGTAVGEQLYTEFVKPYESTETVDRAVNRMITRLSAVNALIVESAASCGEHSAALADAGDKFGGAPVNAALLRDWVRRLSATHDAMRDANAALQHELIAARADLATTEAEIRASRESMGRDPLTGLANRGGIDRQTARIFADHKLHGGALSCAVIDIDHFKSLNDRYGHQVGDEVLRVVTRALLASVRERDLVGRPGGDEFVVIFPHTDLLTAQDLGERIRGAIAESDLTAVLGEGVLGGITASVGLAVFGPGDTLSRMVQRADRQLFEAKRGGRNRVVAEIDRAA